MKSLWQYLLLREKVTATELGHLKLGLELRVDAEVLLFLSIKNLCSLVSVLWEKGESLRTNLSPSAPAESSRLGLGRGKRMGIWGERKMGIWGEEEDGHLGGRGRWSFGVTFSL